MNKKQLSGFMAVLLMERPDSFARKLKGPKYRPHLKKVNQHLYLVSGRDFFNSKKDRQRRRRHFCLSVKHKIIKNC